MSFDQGVSVSLVVCWELRFRPAQVCGGEGGRGAATVGGTPCLRGVTCLHGGGRAVQDGAVRDVRGDHEAQGFPHGQTSQQRIWPS